MRTEEYLITEREYEISCERQNVENCPIKYALEHKYQGILLKKLADIENEDENFNKEWEYNNEK